MLLSLYSVPAVWMKSSLNSEMHFQDVKKDFETPF